jgi:hypothetical protein
MIPTLADLEAYRLFGYQRNYLDAMAVKKSLDPLSVPEVSLPFVGSWFAYCRADLRLYIPQIESILRLPAFSLSPSDPSSNMLQVMRLIDVHFPDADTPALDFAWQVKGPDAKKEDLMRYWSEDRWRAAGAETGCI